MWKRAINTWDDIDKFAELIKANNITVVYFEDRDNYLNKTQWIISDGSKSYWTGSWGAHPFGGRARIFSQHRSYAKKYFSKKVAENAAEKMRENGVFGKQGKYTIEEL